MIILEFRGIEGEGRYYDAQPNSFYAYYCRTKRTFVFVQCRCGPRILTFFLYLSDVEGGKKMYISIL